MNKKLLEVIKGFYKGKSQGEVAVASGLTESTVSLIWNGKREITIKTLEKLSHGLGLESWQVMQSAEADMAEDKASQLWKEASE